MPQGQFLLSKTVIQCRKYMLHSCKIWGVYRVLHSSRSLSCFRDM